MKAFVTGGTGFIGGRLVKRLKEEGYQVTALVRSEKDAQKFRALGVEPALGDIRDKESMRAGMQGADVVFHTAGWYKLGAPDWEMAEGINVGGTRNTLQLAVELGVPKIIYTSTVAVFGGVPGLVADEKMIYPGQKFLTEYDRTKWTAHNEVVEPMIDAGAPVIIVMPGGVYGPGDHSLLGETIEYFFKGFFPVFPAPDLTITLAHVDDIAEGHLLAAQKGRLGESYILAGQAYTMRQLLELCAELSGRPAPLLFLPSWTVSPFAPVLRIINRYIPLPPILSEDAARTSGANYLARADKAYKELGWIARPVAVGMHETLAYLNESLPAPSPETLRRRQAGELALAAAGLLLAAYGIYRKISRSTH